MMKVTVKSKLDSMFGAMCIEILFIYFFSLHSLSRIPLISGFMLAY